MNELLLHGHVGVIRVMSLNMPALCVLRHARLPRLDIFHFPTNVILVIAIVNFNFSLKLIVMIINMVAIIRKKTYVRIEARQTNTMETPNSRKV